LLFCALVLLDWYSPHPHKPQMFSSSIGMEDFKLSFPSLISFSPFVLFF
jgi:hypothetical protein